jgi:Multi-copper polyphenol oxidoreductase laccase
MTLPVPDPAFVWTVEAWGHALRSKPLSAMAQHAFTTKELQLPAGGPRAHSTQWTQAAASLGAGLEQITLVKQVHGASVRVLKKEVAGPKEIAARPEADAIVSDVPGLVLAVQVADCVPILIADSRRSAVAAVHAGWRGTCAGVAVAAVSSGRRQRTSLPRSVRVSARAATRSAKPFSTRSAAPIGNGSSAGFRRKRAGCDWICGARIVISCWRQASPRITFIYLVSAPKHTATCSSRTAWMGNKPDGWRR